MIWPHSFNECSLKECQRKFFKMCPYLLKRCISIAPKSFSCLMMASLLRCSHASFISSCLERMVSLSGCSSESKVLASELTSDTRSSCAVRSLWNSSNFFWRTSTCSKSSPVSTEEAKVSCETN